MPIQKRLNIRCSLILIYCSMAKRLVQFHYSSSTFSQNRSVTQSWINYLSRYNSNQRKGGGWFSRMFNRTLIWAYTVGLLSGVLGTYLTYTLLVSAAQVKALFLFYLILSICSGGILFFLLGGIFVFKVTDFYQETKIKESSGTSEGPVKRTCKQGD